MSIESSLALYGIEVKNITKSNVVIRLKGSDDDTKMSRALFDKLSQSVISYSNVNKKNIITGIKFGVEFEFVGSKSSVDLTNFDLAMTRLFPDKYHNLGKYAHNDGTMWILGKDSSIRCDGSSLPIGIQTGYELSTPILDFSNKEDIQTLFKVINLIKLYLCGEVNSSCGTHIHLGINYSDLYRDDISNLMNTYGLIESKVFDPVVPITRRKNKYCKHTMDLLQEKYQKLSSRYCKFDSENKCKCLHFEFRQLEGTLDSELIFNWITIQSVIITDIIEHIKNRNYLLNFTDMNIFDMLFYYDFDSYIINYFIERVIRFKSRTIQQS